MASERSGSMIHRMVGASRLDPEVYEEVEADSSSTGQAFLVVVLVALATGLVSLSLIGLIGLLVGVVVAIVGWVFWAWLVYLIGTKILPSDQTDADWGQLARTLGFAQSPGVLKVFGVVPVVGDAIFLIVSVWMLFAMVIAVRQALDYTSTLRAIGVVVLGFIPYAFLVFIALALLGTEA